MLSRLTQTNEPARCAVILPALAQIDRPIALIEVGASMGLCLLPDRYCYDYGRATLQPALRSNESPPTFHCAADEATPLPRRMPEIVWRRGLDLNPLSASNEGNIDWLRTLVWPGQEARADRLNKAMAIAREDPPLVEKGDLSDSLQALVKQAPKNAAVVVFHTAVLCYVPDQKARDAYARAVQEIGDFWISNEAVSIFPSIASKIKGDSDEDKFLLAVNGEPTAWTQPHGQSISWIAS